MSSWPSLSKRFVARMLSAHAGLGLIAGAVLYLLSVSGTLVVFHQDFARWEQPGAPELLQPDSAAVESGLRSALTQYRAEHDAYPASAYMILPTEIAPRMITLVGETSYFVDENGALGSEVHHPFSEFLIELHYYLHLPHTLGLIIVGSFGVIMMGLIVSGFLTHPRVLRDAFRFRREGNRQLAETDLHNRLSVWGAPVHFILALTGAMLGLAILSAYLVGMLYHDNDPGAAFEPTFGSAGIADDRAAPIADISAGLDTLRSIRPDVEPWYLDLEYPGTEGQSIKILSRLPRRLIFGEYYQFDAAGSFQGQVGLEDGTVGQQVFAGAYQLHFGSFGGLPVKLAYAVFGVTLCIIVVSGVNLWLIKREARGKPSPRLSRAWTTIVWGTPALIALVGLGAVTGLLSETMLAPVFWTGLIGLSLSLSFVANRRVLALALKLTAGTLSIALVGTHWLNNMTAFASPPAWGVTIMTLLLAAGLLVQSGLQLSIQAKRAE